jgi:hypothetical protein
VVPIWKSGRVVPRHGKAKTAVAEAIKAWHRRSNEGKKRIGLTLKQHSLVGA